MTPSPRRSLASAVALLGLAGCVWLYGAMRPLAGAISDRANRDGLATLELSGWKKGETAAILQRWGAASHPACAPAGDKSSPAAALTACAQRVQRLDAFLIASYVALLGGLGFLASTWLRFKGRLGPWLLSALSAVAGLLDTWENWLMADWLRASPDVSGFVPRHALPVAAIASLKFLLILFVVFALITILFVVARAFFGGRFRRHAANPARIDFTEVLRRESDYLRGRREKLASADPPAPEARPVGLAFSGGGIRSATTNLGVLQALCRRGILPWVDYLATVSGGGYIGSAFSSLLSLNRRDIEVSPRLGNRKYEFADGDLPHFSTTPDRFPFEADRNRQQQLLHGPGGGLNGAAQVEHLRSHGSFLILRQRLFHRDVLRTVGSVLGGIFYHLLMGALALVAIAAGYLVVLHGVAGAQAGRCAGCVVRPMLGDTLRDLFPFADSSRAWPFLAAAIFGLIVIPLATAAASWVVWRLPEDWFRRSADSVDDCREYDWLWTLLVLTLAAAAAATWHGVRSHGPQLSAITLPMAVYVGGWAAALLLHWAIAALPSFTRNQRSRFAAWKGMFNYLTWVSVLVILVPFVLSSLAWLKDSQGFEKGGLLAWLGSLAGSGWLAKGMVESEKKAAAARWLSKVAGPLQKAALAVLVSIAIVLGLLLACHQILKHEPAMPLAFRCTVLGLSLALFLILGYSIDFNKLSLHYFYRDRLAETYLQTAGSGPVSLEALRDDAEMPLTHLHGVLGPLASPPSREILKKLPWAEIDAKRSGPPPVPAATGAPLHLLSTCLNLTRSRDLTRGSRKSDVFTFSKLFCGSLTTGFMDTRLYRDGETKLARAMTISGAAVNSAMGRHTFFAQALAMTLLNVRLGQWMENPGYRGGVKAFRREGWIFWPTYLFQEVLGASDANHRLVHLSDGAQTGDNLGLYPLLTRRCRLILVGDSECDPQHRFTGLAAALRMASVDQGIEVDLDLRELRADAATGLSQRPFAVGRIRYPATSATPAQRGWLVLVKNTLTDEDGELIHEYKQGHAAFPHETTADQFFDEAQFEAYRELGEHMMARALGGELASEVAARGWAAEWKEDLPEPVFQ